jgi:hypothetical protein
MSRSRRGFIIQGYDCQGNLEDKFMDIQQQKLTNGPLAWIHGLPNRGGTADIIPVQFGRGWAPKNCFKFFNYAHEVMTGTYHTWGGRCGCPPFKTPVFKTEAEFEALSNKQKQELLQTMTPPTPSFPGPSNCSFANEFLVVVGQQKPCLYNSTFIKSTPTSKLTKGHIYDIPMARSLVQSLNQIRIETNPRLVVYCDIETLDYMVLWFDVDATIIESVLNRWCRKTRTNIPRMQWNWGHNNTINPELAKASTHACCRMGCRQVTVGSKCKMCKKCGIMQYCSKKCLKKDAKRHAKNCLVKDPTTGDIVPPEMDNNRDLYTNESFATEKPNECATCGKQEKSGDRLKKCACHSVFYCNKDCLRQHWNSGHREECEEMRLVFEATQAAKNKKGKCLYASCDKTTKEGGGALMNCPCKSVQFCSKEHQRLAWPGHKALCKQLRKEMKTKKDQDEGTGKGKGKGKGKGTGNGKKKKGGSGK